MNIDLNLALALVTAHLLADFVFQSDKDVANKKDLAVLGKHALIVAGLSYLLLGDWRVWIIPAVVGLTHFLIDLIKATRKPDRIGWFLADQSLHLAVIAVVAVISPRMFPVECEWSVLWGDAFVKGMIVVSGLILTTHVGGVLVAFWVQPFLAELTRPEKESKESLIGGEDASQRGLKNAGRNIGRWERGLIFFLVLVNKPEAVAFLVAAKSIFRFGELNNRKNRTEAEYITIGTLMSFTWGLVVAWLTWRAFSYFCGIRMPFGI